MNARESLARTITTVTATWIPLDDVHDVPRIVSDYTPTTERVRSAWSVGHGDEAPAEFDRWLNTVKAEAWDEGYWARQVDLGAADNTPNPYRKGADQ